MGVYELCSRRMVPTRRALSTYSFHISSPLLCTEHEQRRTLEKETAGCGEPSNHNPEIVLLGGAGQEHTREGNRSRVRSHSHPLLSWLRGQY
jgi:hypothetical protein